MGKRGRGRKTSSEDYATGHRIRDQGAAARNSQMRMSGALIWGEEEETNLTKPRQPTLPNANKEPGHVPIISGKKIRPQGRTTI